MWKNGFIREYEDFTFIASAVARDLADQNIRYVEAFHSPGDFAVLHGLEVARVTEAVRRGLDAEKERIEIRLIADLTRDFGPERGRALASRHRGGEGAPHRRNRHRGIGARLPAGALLARYIEEARRIGLRTTAHAGRGRGAGEHLGRAPRLSKSIASATAREPRRTRGSSSICARIECPDRDVPDLEPQDRRRRFGSRGIQSARSSIEGLLVSVNTDDPKMFGTSLEAEYLALAEHQGFRLRGDPAPRRERDRLDLGGRGDAGAPEARALRVGVTGYNRSRLGRGPVHRTGSEGALKMSTYERIEVETRGPIGRVTMRWPEKRNALSIQMMQELTAGLRELERPARGPGRHPRRRGKRLLRRPLSSRDDRQGPRATSGTSSRSASS